MSRGGCRLLGGIGGGFRGLAGGGGRGLVFSLHGAEKCGPLSRSVKPFTFELGAIPHIHQRPQVDVLIHTVHCRTRRLSFVTSD